MSHFKNLNESFDAKLNEFREHAMKIMDSVIENQKEQINNLEKINFNNKKAFHENNCTPDFSEIQNYGDKHGR